MRRTTLLVATVIPLIGWVGVSDPTASGAASSSPVTAPPSRPNPVEVAQGDPGFYEVPTPLPAGQHGDLIRWQVIDDGIYVLTRIMYLSETVGGQPTVMTAVVSAHRPPISVNTVPLPPARLIIFGHGSTGLADACAPSRTYGGDNDDDEQDVHDALGLASREYTVVAPDYEGLGGPGVHPFLVGRSEARSMLDAGLAVRQLASAHVGDEAVILFGFSQGGHAALWAAQEAPTWTPTQRIKATILAGPASEVDEYVARGVKNPKLAPAAVSTIAGLAAAYPEAAAASDKVLTPAGRELAALMSEHCFDDEVQMPRGKLLAADPLRTEPFATLIAAQVPGAVKTSAPILLFTGAVDENVPTAWTDRLLQRLCAAGQVVERRVVAEGSHTMTLGYAQRDAPKWLEGLDAGTPPVNSCAG